MLCAQSYNIVGQFIFSTPRLQLPQNPRDHASHPDSDATVQRQPSPPPVIPQLEDHLPRYVEYIFANIQICIAEF